MSKKAKILNANGVPYKHAGKAIEDMTPEERIEAVMDLNRAARQYIRKLTEKAFAYIKMEAGRKKKSNFVLTAKIGIVSTMAPMYQEYFITRMRRFERIGVEMGYNIKFNKWRDTKEYAWFFDVEKD